MSLSPVRLSVLRIDLPLCPGSITIMGPGGAGFGLVGVEADVVGAGEAVVGRVVGAGVGDSVVALDVALLLDVAIGGSTREDFGLNEPHATVVSRTVRPAARISRLWREVPT